MAQLKVKSILSITFLLQFIFLTKFSATECERFFLTSCKDLNETLINSLDQIRHDVVQVQVDINKESFYVKCNQEIDNGGWTVILHRYNGRENFNCKWSDCVKGFGNINGEFFIGLERHYDITRYTLHELMFILKDFEHKTRIAKYDAFSIEDENNAYMIYLLGNYTGNAGDSFELSAGSKFSAKDKDHTDGCTKDLDAPDWFKLYTNTNIIGNYLEGTYSYENDTTWRGMYWEGLHNPNYSLKRLTMMIRPIN